MLIRGDRPNHSYIATDSRPIRDMLIMRDRPKNSYRAAEGIGLTGICSLRDRPNRGICRKGLFEA